MSTAEEVASANNNRILAQASAQILARAGQGGRSVGMGGAAPDEVLGAFQDEEGDWVSYFVAGGVAGGDPVRNPQRRSG